MIFQSPRAMNPDNHQAAALAQPLQLDAMEVEAGHTDNGDLIIHPIPTRRGDALLAFLAQFDESDFVATLEQNQREHLPIQDR